MKKIIKSSMCLATAGVLALTPLPSFALSQDETVYVKLQENGVVKTISVTEHLINDLKDNELFDRSILTNIENLNGFEGFVVEGENVKWDANGKDIYYRGDAAKELPVKLSVSYFLDDEEKTPEEMLGKAGKVEIRLKYTNLSKVGNIWTPFVAMVATTLDESKVSNVTVTNGKAISNGRNVAITAVAAPGLYESLGLAELKNTGEVVLSYETTKFELGDIYSIVTPKLLDSDDLKVFSELDNLSAKSNQLAESSGQLVAGAKSLNDGMKQLQSVITTMSQKLAGQGGLTLDDVEMAEITQKVQAAAAAKVQAQSATIRAGIKQQLAANQILKDAIRLEAEKLCSAKIGGASCPAEAVVEVESQLLAGIEEQLFQSSYQLALTTARQTAAATAEGVVAQMMQVVSAGLGDALVSGLNTMLAGVNRLARGAEELSAGMVRFDQEGIQPLNNFVNGKVRVTSGKVKQLMKLADEYDNYAGLMDGAEGTTKFVLMVEGRK